MTAKVPNNGKAKKFYCTKHPAVSITVYGAPSTEMWCHCGSALKTAVSTKPIKQSKGETSC